MIRSGVPTAMKPPIIKLEPFGISSTDCSRDTVRMVKSAFFLPARLKSARLVAGGALFAHVCGFEGFFSMVVFDCEESVRSSPIN
jgi:hypothetical protein